MKKWLFTVTTVLLMAVLVLGAGVMEVSAAEKAKTTSDGFSYKISKDNTVEITKYQGKKKKLKFPDKIKGKKVTKIGFDAVSYNQFVTSVTIPDTVTKIDITSFRNCPNLTTITLGKNVKEFICEDDYKGDESEFIEVGKKFKAFKVSPKNKVFSAKNGVLFRKKCLVKCPPAKKGTYQVPEGTVSVMLWAFDESRLSTVKIPASVEYISAFAYYENGSCDSGIASYEVAKENKNYYSKDGVLFAKNGGTRYPDIHGGVLVHYPPEKKDASYQVPEDVDWVEGCAFAGHEYLEQVEIPNAKVSDYAFSGCTKLKKAVIPGYLGDYAFSSCKELAEVECQSILSGENTFWGSGLRSLILSENVTELDLYAFGGCDCLKWIEIRNKDCKIEMVKQVEDGMEKELSNLPGKTVIYGYPGSTAEEFAKKAGHEFKQIGEQRPEIKNPETVTGAKIKLSQKTYTYDGEAKEPYVEVKDKSGNKISDVEYWVTYQNNKKPGLGVVKVNFKGYDYKGTIRTTFVIKPSKSKITKLTPGKNSLTLQWSGMKSSGISGYEIQYSTGGAFEKGNTWKVCVKSNAVKKQIKKLKSGKTYHVRIRSYKTIRREGKAEKLYSKWSGKQKVKTL